MRLVFISALLGLALGCDFSPESFCDSAERCFGGDWEGRDTCVAEQQANVDYAESIGCGALWDDFMDCVTLYATCQDGDRYGVPESDPSCDADASAYFFCELSAL